MRLYLSSYRLGDHVPAITKLTRGGTRVAVINNATDNFALIDREEYKKTVYDIENIFRLMEFHPEEVDLRDFFDRPDEMYDHLKQFDLIWVCGGNVFLLRRAMAQSGFDKAIVKILKEDAAVYGGWSAGICVLAPSLKGLELCDNKDATAEGYNNPIIWDGLGIIDKAVVPHFRSDHPEAAMVEDIANHYKAEGIPHVTLRDGDVLIQDGNTLQLYPLEDGEPSPLNANGMSGISWTP